MIPRLDDEWLDVVAALDPADLPYNSSTVEQAIKLALAYREEVRTWQRIVDELLARLPEQADDDR